MPKWICTKCSHHYSGWAMYHRFKSNDQLCCPDCGGRLDVMNDTKAAFMVKDIIGGVDV